MRKAATKKSVTTTEDVVQQRLSALEPKQQFLSAAMNMGWQLGGAVLIPVFIGVRIDTHYHSTPSYTLVALMLATVGAVNVVRSTINKVNIEQAESENQLSQDKPKKSKENISDK